MRVGSFSKAALKKFIAEHERELKKYKNEIDNSRSFLNYTFSLGDDFKTDKMSVYNRAVDRVKEIMGDRKIPSNTNYLSEWILTYPESLCETVKSDTGKTYHKPKDPKQCEKFFELACNMLIDRYGVDNYLGAWVHMDESTPHMHFSFVPEATSRKTGKKTVSSASLLTPLELSGQTRKDKDGNVKSGVQYDMQQLMIAEFGDEARDWILNGRTQGGYTTSELKARTKADKAFKAREKALKEREDAVALRETAVKEREEAVDLREKAQDARDTAQNEREKWFDEVKAVMLKTVDTANTAIHGIIDAQARNDARDEIQAQIEPVKTLYKSSKKQGKAYREQVKEAAQKAREATATGTDGKIVPMPVQMPSNEPLRGYEAEAELGTYMIDGEDTEKTR